MVAVLTLLACKGDNGNAKDDTSGNGGEDYAHPLVPEAYRDSWDVDSVGCEDAIFYWAFEGSIDEAGSLSGEEAFYWFFPDDGGATDCRDAFEVTAVEEPTPVEPDNCYSCDRDFTAKWKGADFTCNWDDYENQFDDDSRDRIDGEKYNLALMIDSDNGMGEMLEQANVWSYAQDDVDPDKWISRVISVGTFTPSGDDIRGPGTLVWAINEGQCVTIKEN